MLPWLFRGGSSWLLNVKLRRTRGGLLLFSGDVAAGGGIRRRSFVSMVRERGCFMVPGLLRRGEDEG